MYLVILIETYTIPLFAFCVIFSISKPISGRLRPNFLSVCKPDWSLVECTDERGNPRYITEDICTTDDAHRLSDSRYAFLFIGTSYELSNLSNGKIKMCA